MQFFGQCGAGVTVASTHTSHATCPNRRSRVLTGLTAKGIHFWAHALCMQNSLIRDRVLCVSVSWVGLALHRLQTSTLRLERK
jgi:hypothetical protein